MSSSRKKLRSKLKRGYITGMKNTGMKNTFKPRGNYIEFYILKC